MVKIGYSVQGLVAKVMDTVSKWLIRLVCEEPLIFQIHIHVVGQIVSDPLGSQSH
jgi:hypothetical protein